MSTEETKLLCSNVWKIYPDSAGNEFLRLGSDPSEDSIRIFKEKHAAVYAVQDASIDIRTGEVFVIMGLSGSGKSTLVRCLSRLIDPTSGTIQLDGEDLLSTSKQELVDIRRHKFGMVFQTLFRGILENGLIIHLNEDAYKIQTDKQNKFFSQEISSLLKIEINIIQYYPIGV